MNTFKGMTQMVYHPGTKTTMALHECVILPVPDDINPDFIEAWLDNMIERLEQDVAQGAHLNEEFGGELK